MSNKIITLAMLKEKNACQPQLILFKEHFNNEVRITEELCKEVYKIFDFNWAAENFLSKDLYEEYLKVRNAANEEYSKVVNPAYEEYNKVKNSAWEEYNKVRNSASKEYNKVRNAAWEEYSKVRNSASKEYNKVVNPALEEYHKVRAVTFCKLFNS